MDNHDLADFMQSVTLEMAQEYKRIQKRAVEDPGTAGDQGEENWATLLRNWLPQTAHIVTKGRILSLSGTASPQVDVLVLHPAYPKHLIDKKLYLAGGVIAAFECKLTLKAEHFKKTVENAAIIRRHLPTRSGTPYKELHSSIIYGLLAHSHTWQGETSKPIEKIEQHLLEADLDIARHPREMLDVVCVADLATWYASKTPWFGPENVLGWESGPQNWYGSTGSPNTSFMCTHVSWLGQRSTFSPIGSAVAFILRQLAWEDPSLRELADYFARVLKSAAAGTVRRWPLDIYSEEINRMIRHKAPLDGPANHWNEWGRDT